MVGRTDAYSEGNPVGAIQGQGNERRNVSAAALSFFVFAGATPPNYAGPLLKTKGSSMYSALTLPSGLSIPNPLHA